MRVLTPNTRWRCTILTINASSQSLTNEHVHAQENGGIHYYCEQVSSPLPSTVSFQRCLWSCCLSLGFSSTVDISRPPALRSSRLILVFWVHQLIASLAAIRKWGWWASREDDSTRRIGVSRARKTNMGPEGNRGGKKTFARDIWCYHKNTIEKVMRWRAKTRSIHRFDVNSGFQLMFLLGAAAGCFLKTDRLSHEIYCGSSNTVVEKKLK